MHTPVEMYMEAPVDLFRRGGAKKPRFDYIRTSPPRQPPQKFDVDVKVDSSSGKVIIDATSGGLSLFNTPDFRSGKDWWVIPKGTELPPGFVFSMDLTDGVFRGHFSIRSINDVELEYWKNTLEKWAEKVAIHISTYNEIKRKGNV
jgi:hypothetical protein